MSNEASHRKQAEPVKEAKTYYTDTPEGAPEEKAEQAAPAPKRNKK